MPTTSVEAAIQLAPEETQGTRLLNLGAGGTVLGVLMVTVEQLAASQLAEAVTEGVNRWGVGVHRAPARLCHQPPPPRHDTPDTEQL